MIFTARMYHNLYNHYSIHVHPPCFQFLLQMSQQKLLLHKSLQTHVLFLWAQFPGVGLPIKGYVYPMQETQEMPVKSLARKDPLEKAMATHSSILAWRIPWTEEPGRLQSTGSQSSNTTKTTLHTCTHLYIR